MCPPPDKTQTSVRAEIFHELTPLWGLPMWGKDSGDTLSITRSATTQRRPGADPQAACEGAKRLPERATRPPLIEAPAGLLWLSSLRRVLAALARRAGHIHGESFSQISKLRRVGMVSAPPGLIPPYALFFVKYFGRVDASKLIEYFLQLADHFRRPGCVLR
jgi:hypothetical protein